MNPFSTADPDTWPMVLTADHMSQIFHRTAPAIKKACARGTFLPAPFQPKPMRWRKVDVLRLVESGRGSSLRRVS